MSSNDFIPRSDPDFNLWQASLMTIVEPNITAWGITSDDFTALSEQQAIWTNAFAKASNKQNRTSADVQAKDDSRHEYEKDMRIFVAQWLSNNLKVSNADRERMGLTVKSNTRTPAPVPDTRPVGTVDFSVRLQHTINFSDELSPRSKAKPDGVHGCEIWMKIDGEPPKDSSELVYQATNTSSPYTLIFEGANAGKVAFYWLRWINTRGERGPWGSTISAMVAG
jgi:hypothetical protein